MCSKVLARWAASVVWLVVYLLPARVDAQDIHHYVARVSGMTTTMQEKQLMTVLFDADELGEYAVDRTSGEVVIKTRNAMDRARFDHLTSGLQVGIVSFVEVGAAPRPYVQGARQRRMADMPLYIDTGAPLRDNQRYDAYKAAWIAVHPDEYRELTAPRDTVPTGITD